MKIKNYNKKYLYYKIINLNNYSNKKRKRKNYNKKYLYYKIINLNNYINKKYFY
jgi:hypothetical protein